MRSMVCESGEFAVVDFQSPVGQSTVLGAMLEEDDVNQSFSGYYGSLFHGTCRPLTRLPLPHSPISCPTAEAYYFPKGNKESRQGKKD
jgi:hypothetical protein